MNHSVQELDRRVQETSSWIHPLTQEISRVVVGQQGLIQGLLIGLLSNGHVLLEGVPGLAKTLTVKTLSSSIDASFQRLQFTPDLLPADLVGTLIYNPKENVFTTRKDPFLVLATQNPLEQEGTYPLPEAQLDRFMLKIVVGYPTRKEERMILDAMATSSPRLHVERLVSREQILQARDVVNEIYVDEKVKDYIVDLVWATREPAAYKLKLDGMIRYGASPRATIFLTLAAKAHAFLHGRGYVTPHDVKSIGLDVLRHRVAVSYEAEAESITSEQVIGKIFQGLVVP